MTSKRWLRIFGIRGAKIVFALSLLLSCLTFGAGDPDAQLRALKGQTPEVQLRLLNEWSQKGDLSDMVSGRVKLIDQLAASHTQHPNWLPNQIRQVIGMLELEERTRIASTSSDAVATAREIKSNPVYRDPGVREEPNWLQGAADRLNNIHPDCSCNHPQQTPKNIPSLGPWLKWLVYGVLAACLIGFAVYAINRFSWSKRLERKAKALLDEGEPERSLDEWLEMADRLEREGKFREAVRCLYLACLLKIDEARIARFERSQTNWEHLARIEASGKLPAELDFREPTKAFDNIWYGMRVKGPEDVARFRAWYRQITEVVRPKAA